MAVITSPTRVGNEKKHWWLRNKRLVDKYIKDARSLIATQEQNDIVSALSLLESALALSPRVELALELKARSLLYLRRFKEVADMLQDYIPSIKLANDDSVVSGSGSGSLSASSDRERVKLLNTNSLSSDSVSRDPSFKCFSVSDLKKKVMAGLCKNGEIEGQWRYVVLGQACCHLGLMEDAMVLLQTGKRLASAAFRRESICWSDDSFDFSGFTISGEMMGSANSSPPQQLLSESESINRLLSHIKLLLGRKTTALAALDAGRYPEAIRHFSKIVDGRRGAAQGFMAECYMHRAIANKSDGRIAESIADCNRTLALDPTCIQALETRAALFESIRCFQESLYDLEHLKLLYNSVLRDRKLPGPAWKRHNVRYREIPGKLCALTTKIDELKQRLASGETGSIDYYTLIGVRRGCSRSELERAHLLLSLRHRPDKSNGFIERCEFADERDIESVKERAKLSALLLYRLLQKGYSSVMSSILDDEATEKQRKKATAALQAAQAAVQTQEPPAQDSKMEAELNRKSSTSTNSHYISNGTNSSEQTMSRKQDNAGRNDTQLSKNKSTVSSGVPNPDVYQGVFCRDLAVVTSLLSQAGFNRALPVKYEALSC